MAASRRIDRPAFYALRPGGWRDAVTLLHLPYTAWHLSYVAIGAALAPTFHGGRLLAALGAFFLAVGVGAHALDEVHGRPLSTRLSDGTLWTLAATSLACAVAIGVAGAITVSVTLVPFVAIGVFLAVAYNLELAGGRFHGDGWFALAWGAFPALTGYWASTLALRPEAVLVATACAAFSLAQRRLSTPVRDLRRRTDAVEGEQRLSDGSVRPLNAQGLAAPLDGALRAMSLATVLLAAALVAARL